MKQSLIIFLKAVVGLIAAVVFLGMIRFPLTEGRAANLDLLSIYLDPFIIYAYVASISFFAAIYEAHKLLGLIGQNETFSLSSVRAIKIIRYAALISAGFIVVGETFLIITQHGSDDMAGPISLGIITTFISVVIAAAAAVLEMIFREGIALKIKNKD